MQHGHLHKIIMRAHAHLHAIHLVSDLIQFHRQEKP